MPDTTRPEYERLRSVLRRMRIAAGMTQGQLAAKLVERQEWVSRYEIGERRLDVVELRRIAASGFGVTVREILAAAEIET